MNKKVLIVDDEPNILTLIEQSLEGLAEKYGVELITAHNGIDALEIIQQQRPSLVFLDLMIPNISGLDICKFVKKDMDMASIYIIMLTARGQEQDKQNGLSVGADFYMTKPFHPRDILAKSLEVLGLD
jgi:DNA-binding response OmpR family regulator